MFIISIGIVLSVGCGESDHPTPAEHRLIAEANAICAESQLTMKEVEKDFPEHGTRNIFRQISYAQAVVDVSMSTAERLVALRAPMSIRQAFERYVEGKRRVYYDDFKALHASHSFHVQEYSAVRKRRESDLQRGIERADKLGLSRCARN
jgi:hypothetical protein